MFRSVFKVPDGICTKIRTLYSSSAAFSLQHKVDESIKKVPSAPIRRRIKNLSEENLKQVTRYQKKLNCTEEEAFKILDKNKTLSKIPPQTLRRNTEILARFKVKDSTIISNAWLLEFPFSKLTQHYSYDRIIINFYFLGELKDKLRLIEKLKPREFEDFVPLIRLPSADLTRLQHSFKQDKETVPETNRIYFFSKRLNVEPAIVAKYFSTHMFMFSLDLNLLEEILNIMIEFEVPSDRILRDLWAFKYDPKLIRERLKRCQETEKGNLKPWMIRCTEDILERSLALTQEKKNVLGKNTLVEYLSQRLNVESSEMERLIEKQKALAVSKASKVK